MDSLDAVLALLTDFLSHPTAKYLVEAFVLPAFAYVGIFSLLLWPLFIGPFAGTWSALVQAGRPGWISFVPIYNWIVLLQIAGLPAWWLILLLVPGVNVAVWIVCCARFARAFGKGRAFGWGLALLPPVYMTILGVSKERHYSGSLHDPLGQPAPQQALVP